MAHGSTSSDPRAATSYAVVTPVRNEAAHIGRTVASMIAQTLHPIRWVIVDDGSTDDTADEVQRAAIGTPWIELIRRADRGHRSAGTGVIEAFEDGRALLRDVDWQYLVKLDGDLEFGSTYFEECLDHFAADPRLGIGGGKLFDVDGDVVTHDAHPAFHVRGATKIYRRGCWDDIGGLIQAPGWDTLDEVKANQLGWATRTFPDVSLYQLRPTGRAAGDWANWVKNGNAAYRSGYHPMFVVARAVRRLARPRGPVALAGLLWGYTSSWLRRTERIDDAALLAYVRQQQWYRLTGRESMWR